MESYRKLCLKQQTELRRILLQPSQFEQALQMFLSQHARLHAQTMAGTEPWSFEDDVLKDMGETNIRRIPQNCEHSVAWILWHMARIEDVAMNLLVAGSPQIYLEGNWPQRIKAPVAHSGNAMDEKDVAELSAQIDIEALRAYRLAVGVRTQEVISKLQPADLKRKVEAAHIQRVLDEGAILETARGVTDYWSRRDIAGLLLMPASRHNLIHLGEAQQLKQRKR